MKIFKYLLLIAIVTLLTGCNSSKYEDAILKIEEGKWDEADSLLNSLPMGYKDVISLSSYTSARVNFNNFDEANLVEDYSEIITQLENVYFENYTKDFLKADILEFQSEVLDLQKKREIYRLKKTINLLDAYEFDKASELITIIEETYNEDSETLSKYLDARMFNALYEQTKSFEYLDKYYQNILSIDSNYDGIFAKDIHEFIQRNIGEGESLESAKINASKVRSLIFDQQQRAEKSPKIGMTAEEVLNSNWGKPRDINKTTTAYGTTEQWVYNGYKYIYLDNGIVTSIQE